MALDATKPDDATLFSKLDDYQRETREALNNLEFAAGNKTFTATELSYTGGLITIGEDAQDTNYEMLEISADGSQTLTNMENGREGQVKQIIARNDNLTIQQNKSSTSGGTFRLNSPEGENLPLQSNDVIVFVNIGGDAGETTHGYWQELYRTLAV